jgi:hypothetical protein
MDDGMESRPPLDAAPRRFLTLLMVWLAFFVPIREMPAAEAIADVLKRVVTVHDLPPGYQQMGEIKSRTYDILKISDATIDFKLQRGHTSYIQVFLKQFHSAADAERDFNHSVQFKMGASENVIARNVGVGSSSIHTGNKRRLTQARHEMVSQAIEAVQNNWVMTIHILNYNELGGRHYTDAQAGKIIQAMGATIMSRLGGRAPVAEGGDCGKGVALTRYLEALRAHQRNISSLDSELASRLGTADADPQQVIATGKRALQAGEAYQQTLKEFQRAETRRGLFEELDLLVETTILLNQVVVKYQALAKAPFTPLNANAAKNSRADAARWVLNLAREHFAARLESEGLRDILTSDSWNEALDKTAFHAQRKVNEFLDRESEKLLGIGFHDVQSAQRALRLQVRREIRRQVAKLLVKVTSNEIVIEIVAGPIIRWLERDLVPRLREALRQKGNLPARVARSLETMESTRVELNRLPCDARLRDVRRRLDSAAATLHATHFLEKDIRAANAAVELGRLADGLNNLSRTISLTRSRFLLVKDDYEEDLPLIDNLVSEMLDNLRRSVPTGTMDPQRFRINDPQPAIDLDAAREIMDRLTGENQYDIPSLQARVTGVRFYEGVVDPPPISHRVYSNRFAQATSRFIWWEINLAYPDPGRRIDFSVTAVCYRPDGIVLNRQAQHYFIQSPWTGSEHSMGFGGHEPGTWAPGIYKVELFVEGKNVGGGTFEITR